MIPGERAREYLRERDPGFDSSKRGHARVPLRWVIAYQLAAVLALGVTVGTLAVPSTAHSRGEAAHLGFGHPISFAWSDVTRWNPSDVPDTYLFNPWETVTTFSGPRFVVDWLVWTAVLWTLLWFLRRSLRATTSWRTPPRRG